MRAIIFLCFALFSTSASAEAPTFSVPDSRNQIIKLTDEGISPSTLKMKVEDSMVFLLNDSKDALTTVEIEFKGKLTHCSSTNMTIAPNNKIVSARPFGPRDFAAACFHEKGSYPFKVYGLSKNSAGLAGTIIVE